MGLEGGLLCVLPLPFPSPAACVILNVVVDNGVIVFDLEMMWYLLN